MNSEKKGHRRTAGKPYCGSLLCRITYSNCADSFLFCRFYVHDRAVLQGLVCETASAGSNGLTAEERGSL